MTIIDKKIPAFVTGRRQAEEEAKPLVVSPPHEATAGAEGDGDAGGQESGKEDVPTQTPDVPQPEDPELETSADGPATKQLTFPSTGDQEAGKDEEAGDSAAAQEEEDGEDGIVKERLQMFATGKDFYCWQCHKERGNVSCSVCPRSYHRKCLPANYLFEGQAGSKKSGTAAADLSATWTCPECKMIREGEERRRSLLSQVSDEDLNQLLISALGTIKTNAESLFYFPVSDVDFPEYKQFIMHPVDFQAIDRNVRRGVYKSTDGFTADVKWILHNCVIYNSPTHVLTKNANYFFKVAKTEMGELEVCPDCFKNYYQFNKTYFIETCRSPHRLVWARLKGHPFWPAKLVRIDAAKREGDCRFFGAHDRAWVPFESIFLLSEQYPWTKSKSHKSKLDTALSECRSHIDKLAIQFPGLFRYADPKTPFNFADATLTCTQLLSGEAMPTVGMTCASQKAGAVALAVMTVRGKGKQKSEVIKQSEEEDEDGMLDDEERPLIIDAPVEDAIPSASRRKTKSSPSSPSPVTPTAGSKRKATSDSGKNKAIIGTGIAVKKSSTSASNAGNGSGAGSTGTQKQAAAAGATAISQKSSKIPTKKAISVATGITPAPASKASPSSSSSSCSSSTGTLTNCPQVRTASKRKESPVVGHKRSAGSPADPASRKARIVNTGSQPAADSGSPAKRSKLTHVRNQTSLLSPTKGEGKHGAGGTSSTPGISGGNNKSTSRIGSSKSAASAVTHASNGSHPVPVYTETGSPANEPVPTSPSSPDDTSMPSSSGKNCTSDTKGRSSAATSSHSALEVKQLKDEIKRLKDQVSKLMIEMKEMREATETQISTQVSMEKEKALSDLESRLTRAFCSQVEDTKRKQWCAHCLKEAIYFCCWNTSYCGYECQSKHWPSHMPACQQNSKTQSSAGSAAAVAAAAATVAPATSPASSPTPAAVVKQQQQHQQPLTQSNQATSEKKKS